MANPFDAAARLAEARPAVDDLAEYVLACHRLGYQNPDLTAHTSQVRDWYDGDAGLDLRALDADCAALAAAADAAEDAARTQAGLVAGLSDVWSGGGAAAAREFARRSGQAATSVSAAVRGAADAVATLRDELWRAVDAKVTTVQAIDGRHRAERGEWLAAARTVTTGAGDVAAASEFVDRHVKPFVQNDVGSDFVGAMRAAATSIGAAYDAAIASASSAPPTVFDVPGELGPRITPGGDAGSGGGIAAVASTNPAAASGIPSAATVFSPVPAPATSPSWSGPSAVVPPPMGPPPAVEPAGSAPLSPPLVTAPSASSPPSSPPMGDLGGAAPALGAGVSGFGQQLADLIGGLVGSFGGTEDLAGADGAVDDSDADPLDRPDEEDDEVDDGPSSDDEPDDGAEDEVVEESVDEAHEEGIGEAPAEPVPELTPVPPPPAPDATVAAPPAVPEAVAETAGQTPCEIAADELPQVGE